MKRLFIGCVGLFLLGTAGLLILDQVVDRPPLAPAQSALGQPGIPPGAVAVGEPPGDERLPVKELTPALIGALRDSDEYVRRCAAAALLRIGTEAVPPLQEGLKSTDPETRANCAYLLGHLRDSAGGALMALTETLKDKDREVRRRGAFAIFQIISASVMAGLQPAAEFPLEVGAAPADPASLLPSDPGLVLPAGPEKDDQ